MLHGQTKLLCRKESWAYGSSTVCREGSACCLCNSGKSAVASNTLTFPTNLPRWRSAHQNAHRLIVHNQSTKAIYIHCASMTSTRQSPAAALKQSERPKFSSHTGTWLLSQHNEFLTDDPDEFPYEKSKQERNFKSNKGNKDCNCSNICNTIPDVPVSLTHLGLGYLLQNYALLHCLKVSGFVTGGLTNTSANSIGEQVQTKSSQNALTMYSKKATRAH